jgi:glycosyltransferase involved in cell wall biosynthesis
MAMIDAGMMGLPVVAFDVGGNNEIVRDQHTGFIVNTREDFLNKCLLLIRDGEKRQAMGARAREHCSLYFGAPRHLNQLTAIYNDVLNGA